MFGKGYRETYQILKISFKIENKIFFKYFLRKGKYLLKRVFVSVLLLLCLKMLIFVLFYTGSRFCLCLKKSIIYLRTIKESLKYKSWKGLMTLSMFILSFFLFCLLIHVFFISITFISFIYRLYSGSGLVKKKAYKHIDEPWSNRRLLEANIEKLNRSFSE